MRWFDEADSHASSLNPYEVLTRMSRKPEQGRKTYGIKGGRAPASGQHLSPEELRALQQELPNRLPAEQSMETMLVLVDVDPRHAHVYWHIDPADPALAARASGGEQAPVLLRLQDYRCASMIGFIPWPPIEIEVGELDGYRHIEIPQPGKTLVAELGLRGRNGAFTILARSAVVRMPNPKVASGEGAQQIELVRIDEAGAPAREVTVLPVPPEEAADLAPLFGMPAPQLPDSGPSSAGLAEERWDWSGGVARPSLGGDHD